jgi:hypothetical protein
VKIALTLVVIVGVFIPPIDFDMSETNYGVKNALLSASVAIQVWIEMILILSMMNYGVRVAMSIIPSTATAVRQVIVIIMITLVSAMRLYARVVTGRVATIAMSAMRISMMIRLASVEKV